MTEEDAITKAKWTGTIDLDSETLAALDLGGLAFGIVVFRVKEMGSTKMVKGQPVRTDTFAIEDMRVLTGTNREQAVLFLAERTQADGQLTIDHAIAEAHQSHPSFDTLTSVEDDEWSLADNEPEEETVFVPSVLAVDDEVDLDADFDGGLGSIYDYKKTAKPEPGGVSGGPKVAKFQPDDLPDMSPATKSVGMARSGPRQRKDKVLERFMEAP